MRSLPFNILLVLLCLSVIFIYNDAYGQPKRGDPARGKVVYEKNCATCHGVRGKGEGPVGRALKPNPSPDFTDPSFWKGKTDEQLVRSIKEGKNAMPPFGKMLTDEDIWNSLAYILQLAAR